MPACKQCKQPFEQRDLLEGICADCIFALAAQGGQPKGKVTRAEYERALALAGVEGAGILQPETLLAALEAVYDAGAAGADKDDAVQRAGIAIHRMAGLGAILTLRPVAESLEKTARSMYEEIQRKVRALSKGE